MPEEVTESEIRELANEFAERFPHLSPKRHFKIVRAGFGNYFGREVFREWYERTIPLLEPEDVNTAEQISWILMYDSYLVPEVGYKPICQLFQKEPA